MSASPPTDTHSPTAVAKVAPYLAINPGLFDSTEHWSYRDLQKLAKRLGLNSLGKRDELVERLRAWHREQRIVGQAGHFHAVQVRATPEGKAISPRLLSPLVQARSQRTPKSALSSKRGGETTPKPLESRGSGVLFSPVREDRRRARREHGQHTAPSAARARCMGDGRRHTLTPVTCAQYPHRSTTW